MKVWRLHVVGETGATTVVVPYRDGESWRTALIPAQLLLEDRWPHVIATGPHDEPAPAWWPRQLAEKATGNARKRFGGPTT